MSEPIGYVAYMEGMALAELFGEDRWRVTVAGKDDPATARNLTEMYRDAYRGPQEGYYGQKILQDAAKMLGGVAVVNPVKPAASEQVY